MKDEYDFSNAQRGTTINHLINQLLRKDIELIQAAACLKPSPSN